MTEHYLLLKALHIISFTAWMAGMFYLPRLLAYHAGAALGSGESEQFKIMERRLLKAIMLPAMLFTWGFGIALIVVTGYGSPDNPANWLVAKLGLVLWMSGLHGFFASSARKFANDQRPHSPKFYKIINELVTVIFVGIVLLVVLKPF
ncbi:MAG: CopD family protein [Rickettsiales bacterium]